MHHFSKLHRRVIWARHEARAVVSCKVQHSLVPSVQRGWRKGFAHWSWQVALPTSWALLLKYLLHESTFISETSKDWHSQNMFVLSDFRRCQSWDFTEHSAFFVSDEPDLTQNLHPKKAFYKSRVTNFFFFFRKSQAKINNKTSWAYFLRAHLSETQFEVA